MASTITAKEAAGRWGLSERRVADLCKKKQIPGAKKNNGRWAIPADAERPQDGRIRNGNYRRSPLLPLPIGISDYRRAVSEYYYVDKTMMIKEFLDEKPMVSLFTRPRRFGKTLNMDMLRTFFEKTEEDTSVYFRSKLIWKQGKKYQEHQGQYPVIFLTFKDVKYGTWDETFAAIRSLISDEAQRHIELRSGKKCSEYDKKTLEALLSENAGEVELAMSLQNLSRMLHQHHGTAPIVIVDEYDTPIQQGHMLGYYDKVISFMRNLFSGVFKDNRHLSYGFLTGILGVAKESIFSGLNNLKVNSILDHKYSEFFGFTPGEVREMARYYSMQSRYDEICRWYDGYRFGDSEIFNPWSVLNYFSNGCQPQTYWQSTGSNDIIGEILPEIDETTNEKLVSLLNGGTVLSAIDTGVVYPQVKENPASIFSFLLVAGYLNALERNTNTGSDFMCRLAIPNREIEFVYRKEILDKLNRLIPTFAVSAIQEALYSANAAVLQKQLEQLLLRSASSFDANDEKYYQEFMLGLTAMMEPYLCTTNREAGKGRYDVQLKPKAKNLPGIIIELKAEKNCSGGALQKLAETAIRQIEDRRYDIAMKTEGVAKIIKFGVAFSGKDVAVEVR